MKSYKKLLILGLSATLLLTGCGGGNTTVGSRSFISGNGTVTFKSPESRKPAPEISGVTLDGERYLAPKGRVSVLNIWASWCAPCRAEAPALAAISQAFPEVNFVGILTRDNQSTARAFVKRFKLSYPTLVDDSILLGFQGSLAANAIPTTIVLDKQGRVAGRISGEITVASLTDLIKRVIAE